MPKFFQPTHSAPSDVYIFSSTPIASDDYILTPGNLYVPNDLHIQRNTRSPHNILNSPWPDVRKAVNAELNTAPTNALLKKSDTIFQFFSVSRYNAPLLYALHRELLTSIPSLSDLPAELSPSTLRFILRHLALFDNLPSHLHYLPISTLTSLIIYLSVPTLESNSRLTAPQDEPVLFLARRHLINLSPSELETFTSLPENPALYIIRRLAKRHLPHDKAFFSVSTISQTSVTTTANEHGLAISRQPFANLITKNAPSIRQPYKFHFTIKTPKSIKICYTNSVTWKCVRVV